jgi:pimeloyl-ACP methyl ester carboxylesterase
MRSRYTQRAAEKLPDVRVPALLVWADGAPFFPNKHAYRLADLIPDARVELVEDSYAFVSEDQPDRTAELIGSFVAENRPSLP